MARAGIPESPHTSNLLQFVMSPVLASNGNCQTVSPVFGAVYEFGLRHGSDEAQECQKSACGDRHPRGTEQRHVVQGRWEAQLC